MPLYEPGRIVLPIVCVPREMGTWKSATAAPEPDDEPPGVREGSWGFEVFGPLCEGPTEVAANSVVVVLPVVNILEGGFRALGKGGQHAEYQRPVRSQC